MSLRRLFARRPAGPPRPPAARLRLQPLDDRSLPSAAGQVFVTNAYADLLTRPVDPGGLGHFAGQIAGGVSPERVAGRLLASDEGRARFVDDAFQAVLRRPADPGGRGFFLDRLREGAPREGVLALIYGSGEYFVAQAGGTNAGYVNRLYQDILGRPADAGGFGHFTGLLARGAATRAEVANVFLTSPENRSRLVAGYYRQFLRREADPLGAAFWQAQLAAGARQEEVIAGFVGSPEYRRRLPVALLSHSFTDGRLFQIDPVTQQATVVGVAPRPLFDLAFHPSFGLFGLADDGTLYRIGPRFETFTRVGTGRLSGSNSLAFAPDGTLYAAGGQLLVVDLATGRGTAVGTGLGASAAGDLVAADDGRLYLTANSGSTTRLLLVNRLSGTTSSLGTGNTGDFGRVLGLAFGADGGLRGLTENNAAVALSLATGQGALLGPVSGLPSGSRLGGAALLF